MNDPQLDLNQHSLHALEVSQMQSTSAQANSEQHNTENGSWTDIYNFLNENTENSSALKHSLKA